jgi:hypothetical protein
VSISFYLILYPRHESSREMLSNLEYLLWKGYLAIDQKYDKVISSLRTANSTEWKLDKEITVSDNSLDAPS